MKTRKDIADLMDDILDKSRFLFQKARNEIIKDCQFLRESAHKEYAQRSSFEEDNALANFERLSAKFEGKVSREQVLWVYVTKHLDGIQAYINGHVSQREPVQGRINDAIVYLILLRGMVDDNREREIADHAEISMTGHK